MISVVFPAYNEEKNVAELHRRILTALRTIDEPFEIVAVENASKDGTAKELAKLSPIKIVSMVYNIGQTAALDAGIATAKGDVVVTLDADLQNDPADIPRMLAKIRKEGFDAVVGWRKERNDPFDRKVFSAFANWLSRKVLGLEIHDYACALKMFKKEYLQGIRLYGEMHVFLAAILHARGARITEIEVLHHERSQGLSKHTFIKGAKDVADLITVKFLLGTSRPLLVFLVLCLGSWSIAAITGTWAATLKLTGLRNLAETPLPVITSLFIIVGVLFIMMGFLAELILRVYYEGRSETPYRIRSIEEK